MDARDPELTKELHATLQARQELGPDYEPALIASFLEKVEQRMDGTTDREVRRQVAERRMAAAREARAPGASARFWEQYGFGAISLALAIPLTAIAVTQAQLPGLVVCWAGIVGINAVHAFRDRLPRQGWPPRESRRPSDREADSEA
ncbi:hypothetical protein ACWEJP_16980 [Streptomyces sp. NPDC004749]